MVPVVPYADQCYKDYYYGNDSVWEKKLGSLEADWGAVFRKILMNNSLTELEISSIREFALYQLQRTVALNEYAIQQKEEFLIEYWKMNYKNRGIPFDEKMETLCKERAKRGFTPADFLQLANEWVSYIQDLEVTIIEYKTVQELITSDVPVIAINQFHQPSIDYSCMGLIILFPVSSKKLVVIYDAKMYPKNKGKLYIDCADESEVVNLNTLQVISANKILLAEHDYSFSSISEAAWEYRSANRDQSVVSVLGNDEQKMFISLPRNVIYHCDFSFGSVCHRFKRIPFVCKEAAPRKWDSVWEKKLEQKEKILPTIIKSSPGLSSQYDLSTKEIRRGCQRMARAAKVYWSQ